MELCAKCARPCLCVRVREMALWLKTLLGDSAAATAAFVTRARGKMRVQKPV